MSLKTKAAIALSVMSSWFGTSAAQNSGEPEKPDSVKRSELIAKPAADKAAKTFTEFHSVQENPDSIQPESIAEIPDSVFRRGLNKSAKRFKTASFWKRSMPI